MANVVVLDADGFIHERLIGNQTSETVDQLNTKASAVINDLHSQQPEAAIRFLVDARQVGSQTLGARQTAARFIRSMPFDKIAIFGADDLLAGIIKLVIGATGRGRTVKQFKDEASARAWLAE